MNRTDRAPFASANAGPATEAALSAKRAQIERVLAARAFDIVHQPVAELRTGRVMGAEALARFLPVPLRSPDLWFADAWEVGLGVALECAAIEKAIDLLAKMPEGTYVALNVAPPTLLDPAVHALLAQVPPTRLVLELTEHAPVQDYQALADALRPLRERGVRLAVDDAGAGFASFQHILQLRPDLIKLDRTLTQNVDVDPARYALAAALLTFATTLGAHICAEGIETVGELKALQRLGVKFGQGYLLARPGPLPLPIRLDGAWRIADEPHSIPAPPRSLPAPAMPRPITELPSAAVLDPIRLETLRSTGLLDSEIEEAFDRFTRLAAQMLNAPIALVSLVDDHRQFFKSAFGLAEPWASRRETPLSHSFCQHVVEAREPFVVFDATTHPLVRNNCAVTELGVAAYVGVPLITQDEQTLGALCVIEPRPRAWSDDDVARLRGLAAAVVTEIELRRALRRLGEREAVFRAIVNHAGVGVMVCEGGGRILRVNRKLCTMLGYDREDDLCGQNLVVLKNPEDSVRDLLLREELIKGHTEEMQVETRYRKKDGTWLWTRVTVSAARDEAGELVFTIGMIEDIEDARRTKEALERSRERYQTLIRHLPNTSVLLFDQDLRFVLADGEAQLDAIHLTRAMIEGKTLAEVIVDPEELTRLTRAFHETLLGKSHQLELERNGRFLALHTAPVHENERTVGMALLYDVTSFRTSQAALGLRTAELALFEEIASASNESRTSTEAFQRVLPKICEHLGCVVGHVVVRDRHALVTSNVWVFDDTERRAPFREATEASIFTSVRDLVGLVAATGQVQTDANLYASSTFQRGRAAERAGLKAGLAFPVMAGSEVVAVIELFAEQALHLESRHHSLLAHIGAQLGRVVEREENMTTIDALAMQDGLTGLSNRRGLLEAGRRLHRESTHLGRPFAVVFVALHGMKSINEQYGHEMGDEVLRDAADILRRAFEDAPVVARLSGDEFVVITTTPDVDLADAIEARIHEAVSAFNASLRRPYRLSVGVGISVFDAARPMSFETLLVEADRALQQKRRLRGSQRGNSVVPISVGVRSDA